jgi:predicted ATPase
MIITLSGFEGSGKSTIVDYLKNERKFLVVPETARILLPLEKTVFENSKDDMSYKSFIAYLSSSHFIFENKLSEKNSVVFDRNIIDSLTYLIMYSEQVIDIEKLKDYLYMFLAEKNRETLYDKVFLINHSHNEEHIKNTILSDKIRQYSSTVDQYIEDAQRWENVYMNCLLQFDNLANEIIQVDAYPDNKHILASINELTQK